MNNLSQKDLHVFARNVFTYFCLLKFPFVKIALPLKFTCNYIENCVLYIVYCVLFKLLRTNYTSNFNTPDLKEIIIMF